MVWYFCMRDWKDGADLDDGWLLAAQSKVKSVLFHLQEYLLTSKSERRKVILSALYEDFSDINQLIEKVMNWWWFGVFSFIRTQETDRKLINNPPS